MVSRITAAESEVVQRVAVRLLSDSERPEFDRPIKEQHYLHDCILTGESLRYVPELDGQWVALIAFSAASLYFVRLPTRSYS